jgi:hypothetical protein
MWSVNIGSKWCVELGSPCQFEAVLMKIRHVTQFKAWWVGACGVGFLPKGNREPIQWRTITEFWLEVDLGGRRWVILMLHLLWADFLSDVGEKNGILMKWHLWCIHTWCWVSVKWKSRWHPRSCLMLNGQ